MTPEMPDSSSSPRAYSTSDPARILIVDDHAIVRHGLARLIDEEDDLEVCAEAGSFGEALEALEREDPDLAVVDLALEGADGLELIKRIASENGVVRSLVLSMYDESLYAERSLRAGASGYVMKEEATRTVVAAIRTVLDGEIYVSDEILDRILRKVSGRGPTMAESPLESLTDRELQVFRLLGEGHSTREVAEILHLSVKTIETHRAKIMRKLDLENATQLLHRAIAWVQQEMGGEEGRDGEESA